MLSLMSFHPKKSIGNNISDPSILYIFYDPSGPSILYIVYDPFELPT